MERGVLTYKGNVYDERVILDKAYRKIKMAHETGKRSYYETVLKDELTDFPVFMQKWFELSKVNPKTSVGLAYDQEYEQFRAMYYALRYKYESNYRWRNLRTFLQLINNQDNVVFQNELENKNFSYLFMKYGVLDYYLINEVLKKVNISESDLVSKDKIQVLINACSKLVKENLDKQKIDMALRENILDPFGNLNIE